MILAIMAVLLLMIFIRYSILTKIQERNEESNRQANCYYYSETDKTIMEYWRKDGIMKLNVKQVNGVGNITFWKDTNTQEELTFWNEPIKIYTKETNGMIERLPNGMMFTEQKNIRLMMAINPTLWIGVKKYDQKECYYLKIGEQEEIIEKSTGLILSSRNGNGRKINDHFDKVTDLEV